MSKCLLSMKNKLLLIAMGIVLSNQTLLAQVPSYVPTNGLVGYWPFNGNANDVSGNGNNGTVNGATLTTDRNGNANSAYDFNYNGLQWNSGLHQVTDIPYNSSFNSNTISVSIWFYARSYFFSGIPGNDKVSRLVTRYQYGYNNPNGQTWGLELSNNQLTAFINQAANDNNQVVVLASTNVSLNQWNHVTFTFDNSILKLYLNGILVSETPKPPTFSLNTIGNSGISVGCSNQANGYWYESDAKIDEFVFWNRALTQQEITTIYNQFPTYSDNCNNVSGSLTQGLVGYWPFCGNANDDSGHGNNGTVNGATLTTDRFGNSNSAYSFDGVDDKIHIGQLNLTSNYSISFWSNLNNSQFQYPIGFGVNQTNSVDIFKGYGIGYSSTLPQCSGLTNSKYFVFDAVSTCNNFIECNNIINPSQWSHVVMSKNGNLVSIYINGTLENSGTNLNLQGIIDLYFGVRTDLFAYFNGILDDIGIWNRALTPSEITQLYNQNQCFTNTTLTDTLVINVGQLSYTNPVTYANNITIAPNPASTEININFNNITNLAGGSINIINSLGQSVANTLITATGTQTTMQLSIWGGTGMYFVQIINAQGQIVDIKKIILQ